MRSIQVVVIFPPSRRDLRLVEIRDRIDVQELIADSTVETLREPVLPRAPGSMNDEPEPIKIRNSLSFFSTNSGPLSDRTVFGTPRSLMTSVKSLTTPQ